MSVPDAEDVAPGALGDSDLRRQLRQAMITGTAITIPFFVTLFVLAFALNLISSTLDPLVGGLEYVGIQMTPPGEVGLKAMGVLVLVGFVFLVGLVAETREEGKVADAAETMVEAIPGVGSVYTSFNRMSQVLLESDTRSFQEVKLVEFPHEGVYTLGFLTADAAPAVETAAGHEDMRTLFLPMAPNPVMGGFLVNVPRSRVSDVDMTVEEGLQAIVTTGLAVSEPETEGIAADRMRRLLGEERSPDVSSGGDRP